MQDKKWDALCLGLAVADILVGPVGREVFDADTTHLESIGIMPGGDAMNQANVLASLGRKVGLAARVGCDDFGNLLAAQAKDRGVDTTLLKAVPGVVTSTSVVLVENGGQRHFVYCSGNNESFCFDDVGEEALGQARVVSIGSLLGLRAFDGAGAAKALSLAKQAGAITVADTAADIHHIGLAGIRDVLPHADYFIPSEGELELLLNECDAEKGAARFLEMGAGNVIVKLGPRGCLAMNAQEKHYIKTYDVPVVDTTGCGDNFTAGVILGILQGKNLADCCRLGNALGSLNAAHTGASDRHLTMQQVDSFMAAAPLL